MKRKILTIIVLLLSYNLIFLFQDLLKSELQIYLLGFRFNLFFLVNLGIIYFYRDKLGNQLEYLKRVGEFKNWLLIFFVPILTTAFTLGLIKLLGYLFKFKRPDFLIEFGLSSLIDLPIYFLWNLPFLFSTLLVIIFIIDDFKFFKIMGVSLLFAFGFIFAQPILSFEKINFEKLSYLPLIFAYTFYNLIILRVYRSFWITAFSVMSSIYSFTLVLGSTNKFVIKTFFARMYTSWDGLFTFKKFDDYLIDLFYAGVMILFAILFFIFDKKKNDNL